MKDSDGTCWNVADCDELLAWHNHLKCNQLQNKEAKLKAWTIIQQDGKQLPVCKRWTDDNKGKLLEVSRVDITLGDTALGGVQKRK